MCIIGWCVDGDDVGSGGSFCVLFFKYYICVCIDEWGGGGYMAGMYTMMSSLPALSLRLFVLVFWMYNMMWLLLLLLFTFPRNRSRKLSHTHTHKYYLLYLLLLLGNDDMHDNMMNYYIS